MDFLLGGTAATCAGVFSNPFDVIKTRQQLQGELQKHVKNTKQPYGTQWSAIKTIVKSEGLLGLQKGKYTSFFKTYFQCAQFNLNFTRDFNFVMIHVM